MTSSILDQFVNRVRRLYSLPAVATQVVELTHQPAVDTKALKECIENEPALVAKLLLVANSSLFGSSPRVTDLNQALALLGPKRLQLLLLGFSLPQALLAGLEADVLQRYWRRTMIKAVAARELAETLWRMPGDDAFIAGLLQNLGMLALMQDLGDTYLTFLERIYRDGGDLLAFETATLGFDHATLSARLLEHWGLPASIVRDVSRRFDADTLVGLPENERAVPQILHVADLIAEFLTRERADALDELIDVVGRYRGVSIDELEPLIASLELKVPQLAEVLSLHQPNTAAYSAVLSQARTRLPAAVEPADLDVTLAAQDDSRCSDAAAVLHQVPAPGLFGSVEAAVKTCRQARHALSLALLELDHADPTSMQSGMTQAQYTMDRLQSLMLVLVDHSGRLMQVDDGRMALVLEGFERQQAVELTRRLVRSTREWSATQATTPGHLPKQAVSLSAGVATLAMPPQNFPCQELIAAAERCLHGVQLSGGDSVKSIDI